MLRVNNLTGFGAGRRLPVITYRTFTSNTANLTTYSFASIDVGADPCLVVVAAHAGTGSNRTLSSGTIDGGAATVHQGGSAETFVNAAIMSRRIAPTGVITIGLTWSGAASRSGIGVWTIQNNLSDTPVDSDQASGTALTMDFSAYGVGVIAGSRDSTSSITVANASERYDSTVEALQQFTGADYTATAAESRTMTFTTVNAVVGATWR
jgi:hypothetical protein